ncbi:MAG: hypothetical protein AAF823_09605 [Planctomycetota bacterium]
MNRSLFAGWTGCGAGVVAAIALTAGSPAVAGFVDVVGSSQETDADFTRREFFPVTSLDEAASDVETVFVNRVGTPVEVDGFPIGYQAANRVTAQPGLSSRARRGT